MASKNKPRADRAKQFSAFDALSGLRAALREKERITVPKAELAEESAVELDRKLRCISVGDVVTAVYFCDGDYLRKTGMVAKIDVCSRRLTIVNTEIFFDDIYDIDGDIFPEGE